MPPASQSKNLRLENWAALSPGKEIAGARESYSRSLSLSRTHTHTFSVKIYSLERRQTLSLPLVLSTDTRTFSVKSHSLNILTFSTSRSQKRLTHFHTHLSAGAPFPFHPLPPEAWACELPRSSLATLWPLLTPEGRSSFKTFNDAENFFPKKNFDRFFFG